MFEKIKYGELNYWVNDKDSYVEITRIEKAKEWGEKYYGEWSKEYRRVMNNAKKVIQSKICQNPLEEYCGFIYRQVNDYLRTGNTNDYSYCEVADLLAVVLCTAPRIPCNLVVYRMVSEEVVKKMIQKNKDSKGPLAFTEEGFMSTCLVKEHLINDDDFSGYNNMLKIYVPKGTIGVYVSTVVDRGEEEILLFPGMCLQMVEYPKKDEEIGKMIFECELKSFNF